MTDQKQHPAQALLSHSAWQSEGPRVGNVLSPSPHRVIGGGTTTTTTTPSDTLMVVAYAPSQPSLRLPELWRVQYATTSTSSTESDQQTHDEIWLEQDFVDHDDEQQGSMTTTTTSSFPPSTHYERLQERLQHELDTVLLPQLLLVAVVEEALHEKMERYGGGGGGTSNTTTTSSSTPTTTTLYYEQPKYYKHPPSHYMVAPVLQTTTSSSDPSNTSSSSSSSSSHGYTPSAIAHRLRAAAKLAHDHYASQQYVKQYQQQQLDSNIRRSSRLPPPPPPAAPQIWQKGGRTAMYLLENDMEESSKEESKEESNQEDVKPAASEKKKKKKRASSTSSSTSLPTKRERKQVQHEDNQEALEEVLEDDLSQEDENENDDEEEFIEEESQEDESDEELQVDDRRVAEVVPEEDDEEEDDESSSEEDDDSDAETIADISDLIHENPYLTPTRNDLLESLGRPGKAWTAADVQDAILFCLEHKVSFEPSLELDHVALGTRSQQPQEQETLRVVLECTSGEKLRELKKMDPAEFSRRKFCWKVAQDDDEEEQRALKKEDKKALRMRLQMEHQEAELQYKGEKAWASWRHRGINTGHAVWPQWEEAWRAQQKPRETTSAVPQVAAAAAVDEAPTETAPIQENGDADLALALESSGRRRTRRGGASNADGVYYGQQSSMTSKQLMDAIVRLVSAGSFQSLVSLQTLVQEESTNPVHRVRVAVGRLLWKRNQLTRCTINALWSDTPLWNALRRGPLLKPAIEPETKVDLSIQNTEDTPVADGMDESGALVAAAKEKSETDDSKQLEVLASYLKGLHQTELQLRSMILDLLTYTPIAVVATAADERMGSMEAADDAYFEENAGTLRWISTGHSLLGKVIFRPPPGYKAQEGAECQWYMVRDFVPAVELQVEDEETTGDTAVSNPRNVERRARFRVFPYSNSGETNMNESNVPIVLTEAQVHAGMVAAGMQQEQTVPDVKSSHPFTGVTCQSVTLRVIGSASDPAVMGKIVGHDTVVSAASNGGHILDHQILFLPEALSDTENTSTFWASVRADGSGNVTCQRLDNGKSYSISQSDFHTSSPAFQACRKVVEFLRHQPQSQVFAEPVDPVALNIPTYLTVIKNPMDISTLSSNLESGKYSQIPPGQSPGRHPVARMLNGPFKNDVFQIFDNAMLFNPAGDWINLAAAATKKNVAKKIEQMSKEADQGLIGSHYLRTVRKSVYVDPDSDVDMYEYESDRDDEDYDARNGRQRRKRKRPSSTREECSTRATEGPIRLQHVLSESQGLRGPFADINIRSDASEFSMSDEWNCRHKVPVVEAEPEEDPEEKQEREELAELFALQREAEEIEQAGLRRSSRAHAVEQAVAFESTSNQTASDLEYFLVEETCPPLDDMYGEVNAERTASDRSEVEAHREAMHEEYFAVLYQRLFKRLRTEEGVPYGTFAHNLFPPFLGRVVPLLSGPGDKSAEVTWEIRKPYLIPAIRWVLRGLVQSGHFVEVEPGAILANNAYALNEKEQPFDVLDMREMQRRKRATAVAEEESSEEEVEMSEYEKLRAERVARNAERLKALGLV